VGAQPKQERDRLTIKRKVKGKERKTSPQISQHCVQSTIRLTMTEGAENKVSNEKTGNEW